MNIITNADVKKFLTLVSAGIKEGSGKELVNYTSGDGKEYFVKVEFTYRMDKDVLQSYFNEDSFELTNQINDLMNGL